MSAMVIRISRNILFRIPLKSSCFSRFKTIPPGRHAAARKKVSVDTSHHIILSRKRGWGKGEIIESTEKGEYNKEKTGSDEN